MQFVFGVRVEEGGWVGDGGGCWHGVVAVKTSGAAAVAQHRRATRQGENQRRSQQLLASSHS
jgi:hypothetical protein